MEFTSSIGQGGQFLLQFVFDLIIMVLLLRFLLRATYADWRHPIVQFIAKVTNPLCAPANKMMPVKSRWDWAALSTAVIFQALFILIVGWLANQAFGAAFIGVVSFIEIANDLLDLIFWLIIIQAVLSWISQGHNPNAVIFDQITRPILAPFQRLIPPISGLDLSPLFAILAIKLTQIVVIGSLYGVAQQMIV